MPESQGVSNIIVNRFGHTTSPVTATPGSIGTTGGTLLAANTARKYVMLQNNSTSEILIGLGSTVNSTKYNFVLGKASAARDGTGGTAVIDNYSGIIYAGTTAGTAVVSVTEVV